MWTKQKYPVRLQGKSLTTYDEFAMLELVLQRPGIYLHEICKELLDTTGTDTSVTPICKFLKKCGFIRTKLQRNEERQHFLEEVQMYNVDMFVYVDEIGSDRSDSMRKFGYVLRGKHCKATN